MNNLFSFLPANPRGELIEPLLQVEKFRIERIVSHGHASPEGFWYDQPENEWILIVQGAARLRLEEELIELRPGDYLNLPARCRHRVEWTTPDEPTIWLAVFYG